MRIQIRNFRGLTDLSADIAPILLLAGSNAAGKSSACVAIGAVASGSLLPFEGMTKKAAQLLVHDGQEQAQALITTAEGTASAAWPSVERATEGRFRDASPVAVGLEDLTAMKAADRAGRLIALIGAVPTDAELTAALLKEEIPEEFAAEVCKKVKASGWDGAHAFFKEEGAKLKGQWEKLASERYGSAKAQTWRPKGWALDLEGASIEALQERVTAAEEALNTLTRQAGADAATVQQLKEDAGKLAGAQRELETAMADLDTAMKKAIDLGHALEKLGPKPKQDAAPLVCPCCQAQLRLVEGALIKPAADDDPELLAIAMGKFEAAEKASLAAIETRELARTYARTAQNKVDAAEAAKAKLALQPKESPSEESIKEASAELEKARAALTMKNAVIEGMALTLRIQRRATIVGLLDKDGVRQTVLVDRLGAFNGMLVENCRTAGWSPVHIDADMGITYGGRTFSLCSGGEQFRARTILQITIAQKEEAPLLVIDGADILDRPGRNGLLGLLGELKIPAVIGITVLRREDMPDLAKVEMGNSVWIADGAAEQVQKVAA